MAAAKKSAKKATRKKATKKAARKGAAKKSTRKAAKKGTRKASGATAQLVVASKVKDRLRQGDVRMSSEFLGALNSEVDELVDRAVGRAKGNGRATVRPQDL